jgi:hypothetical protein
VDRWISYIENPRSYKYWENNYFMSKTAYNFIEYFTFIHMSTLLQYSAVSKLLPLSVFLASFDAIFEALRRMGMSQAKCFHSVSSRRDEAKRTRQKRKII